MFLDHVARDRRAFLRLSLDLSAGALLSACGGGGAPEADAVTVVTAPTAGTASGAAPPTGGGSAHPLGLALNLAYLGQAFYGVAASGSAPAGGSVSGTGAAGNASGGRQAALSDPIVAALAAELAADKSAHVAALRTAIGAAAPAQPAIDLSPRAGGAFSRAAQGAGIVVAGAGFDPYVDDRSFLLGAFLVEHAAAATYRTHLLRTTDAEPLVTSALADAIYHGGAVRALLDARGMSDASIEPALRAATTYFGALDGSAAGERALAGSNGNSIDLLDPYGVPIPFTRGQDQVLRILYLSSGAAGGFFPAGANGVA